MPWSEYLISPDLFQGALICGTQLTLTDKEKRTASHWLELPKLKVGKGCKDEYCPPELVQILYPDRFRESGSQESKLSFAVITKKGAKDGCH